MEKHDGISNIVNGEFLVRKICGSFYLLLNTDIRKRLHIEEGTVLGCKIWNISTKTLKCPKCKFEFNVKETDDPHDCPKCGTEFLDVDAIQVPDNESQT